MCIFWPLSKHVPPANGVQCGRYWHLPHFGVANCTCNPQKNRGKVVTPPAADYCRLLLLIFPRSWCIELVFSERWLCFIFFVFRWGEHSKFQVSCLGITRPLNPHRRVLGVTPGTLGTSPPVNDTFFIMHSSGFALKKTGLVVNTPVDNAFALSTTRGASFFFWGRAEDSPWGGGRRALGSIGSASRCRTPQTSDCGRARLVLWAEVCE